MGLKADNWIGKMALEHKMIESFCEANIGKGIVSYGLLSYSYDIRAGCEPKIFTNVSSTVTGPKNFLEENVVDFEGDVCIVPVNSFALARTIEYFKVPDDVLTICLGKSTYARCDIIVGVTPFEPDFEGHITIEISNTIPLPTEIYASEGIAQVLFLQGDEKCDTAYKDKKGKYQAQTDITLPRVLKWKHPLL